MDRAWVRFLQRKRRGALGIIDIDRPGEGIAAPLETKNILPKIIFPKVGKKPLVIEFTHPLTGQIFAFVFERKDLVHDPLPNVVRNLGLIHVFKNTGVKSTLAEFEDATRFRCLQLFSPISEIDIKRIASGTTATLGRPEELEHIGQARKDVGSHVARITEVPGPGDQVEVHIGGIGLTETEMTIDAIITENGHDVVRNIAQEPVLRAIVLHGRSFRIRKKLQLITLNEPLPVFQ
jgi:hypothetical protein